MPHVIIFAYDENNNIIGEYHPGHDEPNVAAPSRGKTSRATEPPKIVLYLELIGKLLGISEKETDTE